MMEVESWFLNVSGKLIDTDIYAARSWLLTARSIFPQNFRLQIEEYMLELSKKNVTECSKILCEIFRDFSNETAVWEEIEKLIKAIESTSDPLRKAIFEDLPALTQQRMILSSASTRSDITQHCKLLLLLMTRLPETISQYGMILTEKLVETEKKGSDGAAVNHYRKILVRDVLPVICRANNIGVSHKHFYKWLQKSTEFYASYFTCESETNVENSWIELEELRCNVAKHCAWNVDEDTGEASSTDRMMLIRDLFRRSRTDVDGAINRKQIFYTALILLFEAASAYMSFLCPGIYRECDKVEETYIIVRDPDNEEQKQSSPDNPPVRKAAEINEAFQVGKEAWNILHAVDTFEKDFNHLIRRWKCERWFWFQLFVCNLHIYEADHKAARERLQLIEIYFDEENIRREVRVQTYSHLIYACFSLDLLNDSCHYIFKCLLELPDIASPNSTQSDHVTQLQNLPELTKLSSPLFSIPSPPKCPLTILHVGFTEFLPSWINILIQSLIKVSLSLEDDLILGHMMVLSQHNWPTWRRQCHRVLQRIAEKRSFHFEPFSQFVINIDILEEIALLKNNQSCQLTLFPSQSSKGHVTRGVNRAAEEEFWKAINDNVQRSGENIDVLLRNYLLTCKNSIIECLNMVEPR